MQRRGEEGEDGGDEAGDEEEGDDDDGLYGRASVYKCSRCGQPKKRHVCTAPHRTSRPELQRQRRTMLAESEVRMVWREEEDAIILASVAELGARWVEIAGRLPGRSDHAARNRYHR